MWSKDCFDILNSLFDDIALCCKNVQEMTHTKREKTQSSRENWTTNNKKTTKWNVSDESNRMIDLWATREWIFDYFFSFFLSSFSVVFFLHIWRQHFFQHAAKGNSDDFVLSMDLKRVLIWVKHKGRILPSKIWYVLETHYAVYRCSNSIWRFRYNT